MFEIVAIAVIEGEADEASALALLQAAHGLVERDHVEVRLLHLVEHGFEEFGRDLEDAVRRKGLFRPGTHVMQGEDQPMPLGIGREQAVGARVVEPGHRGFHHLRFHTGHGTSLLSAIKH